MTITDTWEVTGWIGNGAHLWRNCPDIGRFPKRQRLDARTVRCAACILRSVAAHHRPESYAGCGTHAGYNRHRARGEDPCWPCKDGERDYNTARRRVQRKRVEV